MTPSYLSHWLGLLPFATLSIIFLGVLLVQGATLPSPHNVSRWSSNTTYNPSTAPPYVAEQCTDASAWGTSSFTQDCKQVLEYFLSTDVISYGSKYFDFHDQLTPQLITYPPRVTPHRYTFGSCVIAIDMVRSFPKPLLPLPVPQAPEGGWPERDFANYIHLYAALRQVIRWCTESPQPAGWVRAGLWGGIGLFVFGKHSGVDFAIPGSGRLVGEANGTTSQGSATERIEGMGSSTA